MSGSNMTRRNYGTVARMTEVDAGQKKHEVEEWSGLVIGDMVTLVGERGAEYRFLGAVINTDTDECMHVNLFGGKIGKVMQSGSTGIRQLRAVRPERIKIPDVKNLTKQRKARALKLLGDKEP